MYVILAIVLIMLVLLVVWMMMQLWVVVSVLEVLLVVVRPRVVMMDMMIVLIVKLRSSRIVFKLELMLPSVMLGGVIVSRVIVLVLLMMNMPDIDLVHVRILDMTMSGFHHQVSLQFAHPIHIHPV
jgi:hypothetical protein